MPKYLVATLLLAILAFVALRPIPSANAVPFAWVELVAQHSGKCIDIQARGTANGTRAIQYTCNGGTNQLFDIYADGGYWEIYPKHTPGTNTMCLDVKDGSHSVGAQIQIYECNNTPAQRWIVWDNSVVINQGSGLCLAVQNGSYSNNAAIIQDNCGGYPYANYKKFTERAGPTQRYKLYLYPPGDGGYQSYSRLNCKWHGGCGYSEGTGLDWDSWTYLDDIDVLFRAQTQSLDWRVSGNLLGRRKQHQVDPLNNCSYQEAWIYDPGLGPNDGLGLLKGVLRYYHVITLQPDTNFWITLTWSENAEAAQINDQNCSAFYGLHTHEESSDHTNLSSDPTFSGGTYGVYCTPQQPPNDDCIKIKNNGKWSRYWQWGY